MTQTDDGPRQRRPRGPYAKSDAVRAGILDACLEVFAQFGFRGTTMKDVAARAGISHTGLLHHFPTKAALLDAVLRRRYDDAAGVIMAVPRRDVLAAQARVLHENTAQPGIIQLHTIISAEATSADHPAHDFFAKRLDDFREYLTRAFEDAQAEGRLKIDAEPEQLSNLYMAVQDGLQLQWLYNPGAVDIEQGVRIFLSSIIEGDLG
ncbi:TetR/AcrR family transcriptional regulator [Arthrobacter sp. W4I7]|uniref:TetR/AcrR family transcriptional regulator n=1 Tax=Arthrobacter sp. W4I7 TaxID=3042296 RepID=UPI0027869112|nr:TetR/AcrR family transcriptional regulator [Arthrobacter sp. W4I7]MDQ0691305.1 AcrR family transcriptional regulator [Arthrobacter sp. W4I7]